MGVTATGAGVAGPRLAQPARNTARTVIGAASASLVIEVLLWVGAGDVASAVPLRFIDTCGAAGLASVGTQRERSDESHNEQALHWRRGADCDGLHECPRAGAGIQ